MHDGYNLLVGALAVRKGFIDKDQLVAAWEEATSGRRLLVDVLNDKQWLSAQAAEEIEQFLKSELGDAADVLLAQLAIDGEALRAGRLAPALAGQHSAAPPHSGCRGRYTLVSPFAQGALGQIWLARDPQLGREVALKEMLPQLCNDQSSVRRFLTEAKITGQLQHPHIVPVHELFPGSGNEQPFFAMRFIEGTTLEEAIAALHSWPSSSAEFSARRLPLLRAFVDVCEAIGYAHSRGIAHRDLKPANIVLGDYGERFVLDWGLAKHFDIVGVDSIESGPPIVADDLEETIAGQIVGTPAFMSPEQAAGEGLRIGSKSDIYGLGAILFAILTGESPHERLPQGTLGEFVAAIRSGKIPRARAIERHVPRALEAVCHRALATNPEDRYGSAMELANDVQSWMDGEPVSAYREPIRQRMARWAIRHQTATQAAAAALLTLLVVAATLMTHSLYSATSIASSELDSFKIQARQVQASVDSEVGNLVDQVRFVAKAPQFQRYFQHYLETGDKAAAKQSLTDFCKEYLYIGGRYLSMQVALAKGHEELVQLYRKSSGSPVSDALLSNSPKRAAADLFEGFAPSGEPRVSALMTSAQANANYEPNLVVVRASAPVLVDGKLVAVVALDKEIGRLLNAILQPTDRPGIVAYVVNDQGKILFHASAEGPLHLEAGSPEQDSAERSLDSSGQDWAGFFQKSDGPAELLIPPVQSPSGDAVYLGKVSYGPQPAEHYVGLVIKAKYDSVIAEAVGKHNRIGVLAAFLMAVSIGAAVFFSRLLTKAAYRE